MTLPTTLTGPTVPSAAELKAVGHHGLGDTTAQRGLGHCSYGAGPTVAAPSTAGSGLACTVEDVAEDQSRVWVLGPLQGSAGTRLWYKTRKESQKLYKTKVS